MGSVAGYQIHLFSNRSQSLIKVPCRMSRSGMQRGKIKVPDQRRLRTINIPKPFAHVVKM